ncbi:MAG: hypothetical protein ACREVA_03840 [Burkholderiales bacterium]
MKTTTVRLWLRVENNSKFIRGKKRARQDIEDFHLQQFGMKKLNEREYDLTFSYSDDEDLDRQVYRLMQDMELEADLRHCFTEADMREIGTDRSW